MLAVLLFFGWLLPDEDNDNWPGIPNDIFEEYLESVKKTSKLKDYTVTTTKYIYNGLEEHTDEYITMATNDDSGKYNEKYYRYADGNIIIVEGYSSKGVDYATCEKNGEEIDCKGILNNTTSISEINKIKDVDYLGFFSSNDINVIGEYFENWFYNFDYNNQYFDSKGKKEYAAFVLEDNWFSKDEYKIGIRFNCKYYDNEILKNSSMTVYITFEEYIKDIDITIKNTWDSNESTVRFKTKISTKYNKTLEK